MPTENISSDGQHPFTELHDKANSRIPCLRGFRFVANGGNTKGGPLLTTALKNVIAVTVAERKRERAEEREIKASRMCACVLFVAVLHIPSGVRRPWAFER